MHRLCVAVLVLLPVSTVQAGVARIDVTPAHVKNHFSPRRALGAGVDAQSAGAIDLIYTPATLDQMLSAGWGPVSYRLFTELGVQDWHWNPAGSWSAGGQGYWTGSTVSSGQIRHSYGYRLPHRGFTHDQAADDDYSRLVDGDQNTYWKSNPYLTASYTGESDALHPQWIVVDLGRTRSIGAIHLDWADPYATAYRVEYWTGADAINDPANGSWQTFPLGTIGAGSGGSVTLNLVSPPGTIDAEFVRVLMTASSGTCDTHGSGDPRNCVGYAVREIGIGQMTGATFVDFVRHAASAALQSVTYVSSVDPWHAPTDQVTDEEQAGLDLVFTSGLTRGLPTMVPVAMLYGVPNDAAAEITYLEGHGYPISYVEMGEEPDGQYILPEDYGELYLQWATAVHAVDASLQLGGPVFQGLTQDIPVWPDASNNTSWFTRFLNYLRAHARMADFNFLSFEHYPFEPCQIGYRQLLQEPALINGIMQAYIADGLPPDRPMFVSEYNISAGETKAFQDVIGALWHADFLGSFLTAGGTGAFYYEYEPTPLDRNGQCASYGAFGMFSTDDTYQVKAATAQYFSTQLVTQEWAQPVDATHDVFAAASDVTDTRGNVLVTTYAVHRPDGQWAVLLVNKDRSRSHAVTVSFHDDTDNSDHTFTAPVTMVNFGRDNYRWHPHGRTGFPAPDGPPVTSTASGGVGAVYMLPKGSITVLRGSVA